MDTEASLSPLTEAGEGGGGGLSVLALHGEDQLVAVGRERLLVVAFAEISAAQVAVRPTLPCNVSQRFGHRQVLLHVGHRLREKGGRGGEEWPLNKDSKR